MNRCKARKLTSEVDWVKALPKLPSSRREGTTSSVQDVFALIILVEKVARSGRNSGDEMYLCTAAGHDASKDADQLGVQMTKAPRAASQSSQIDSKYVSSTLHLLAEVQICSL